VRKDGGASRPGGATGITRAGTGRRTKPTYGRSHWDRNADEAELIAALEGLRRIEDGMTVHVYSDSQLVPRILKDLIRQGVKASPLSVLSGGESGASAHRKHGTPLRRTRFTEFCGQLLNELARFPQIRAFDAQQERGRLGVVHRLSRLGSGLCKEMQRANAHLFLGQNPISAAHKEKLVAVDPDGHTDRVQCPCAMANLAAEESGRAVGVIPHED
jgi:hypothetical protein